MSTFFNFFFLIEFGLIYGIVWNCDDGPCEWYSVSNNFNGLIGLPWSSNHLLLYSYIMSKDNCTKWWSWWYIYSQWRSQRGVRGAPAPPWLHLKFLCKCKGLWHKEKERKKWLPIGGNLKMVMTQEKESKKKKKSQTSNPFHLIYCFCRLLSCPTRLIIIS